MAYKNLVAQICTDKADWFTRLRDFLCARDATHLYSSTGIGWTLHDSSYAVDEDNPELNDWFVVFSAGESGKETLYYKITWGSNDIIILGYSYWDNSAHTGTDQYGNAGGCINVDDVGANYDIYIYGDMDFVHAWETIEEVNSYMGYFGNLQDDVYDTTPAQCSSSITSGSDVSVLLDVIPSGWVAGSTTVLVRYRDTVERTLVKTINTLTITVDLVNSYSANAIFQEQVGYVVNNSASSFSANALYNHELTGDLTTNKVVLPPTIPFSSSSLNPDVLYDDYFLFEMLMGASDAWYGKVPNIYFRPLDMTEKTTHSNGSDTYRMLKAYSSIYTAIKEV